MNLAELIGKAVLAQNTSDCNGSSIPAFGIVLTDRGFVWVGELSKQEEFVVITNAKNIRYWGTTNGIGELALNGPTSKTKLDMTGTVRVPYKAVLGILNTEKGKW